MTTPITPTGPRPCTGYRHRHSCRPLPKRKPTNLATVTAPARVVNLTAAGQRALLVIQHPALVKQYGWCSPAMFAYLQRLGLAEVVDGRMTTSLAGRAALQTSST